MPCSAISCPRFDAPADELQDLHQGDELGAAREAEVAVDHARGRPFGDVLDRRRELSEDVDAVEHAAQPLEGLPLGQGLLARDRLGEAAHQEVTELGHHRRADAAHRRVDGAELGEPVGTQGVPQAHELLELGLGVDGEAGVHQRLDHGYCTFVQFLHRGIVSQVQGGAVFDRRVALHGARVPSMVYRPATAGGWRGSGNADAEGV